MGSPLGNLQVEQLEEFVSSLCKMKQENKYTDVVLVCNEKEFPVHKVVLAAQSAVFSEIFDASNESNKIALHWLESETLEILLEFMYSRNLSYLRDDSEKLKQLLDAAYHLKMDKLVGYCCDCFMSRISTNDFTDTILLAEKYKCQKLKTHVIEYLAENFDDSLDSRDILRLTSANLRLILSHPLLAVDEDDKMRTILKWIKHDEEDRLEIFANLLAAIDFDKLSTRFLIGLADDEPLLSRSPAFMQLIIKAMAARLHLSVVNHLQTSSYLGTNDSSKINSFSVSSGSSTISQASSNNEDDNFFSTVIGAPSKTYVYNSPAMLDNAGFFLCSDDNSLICATHMITPRSSDKMFSTTTCFAQNEQECMDEIENTFLCDNELRMDDLALPVPLLNMVCDMWELVVGFVSRRVSRELFLPSFLSLTNPAPYE